MKANFRKYKEDDFIRIRDFLKATYKETGMPSNWLIDRWNFVRYVSQTMHETFDSWPDTVGLWEDSRGSIISVVCSEGELRGEAFFQMSTHELPEELLQAMFEYAENNLALNEKGMKRINLRIPENALAIERMALERGYRHSSWNETISAMDLRGSLSVSLPEGFEIRSGNQLTENAQGIAHAKAFGYIDTDYVKRSPLCYAMLKKAPDYRADLDLAVVNKEGEIVSFCTVWYDSVNQIGILEPVGTHSGYRKMGLGRAVIYEGLNRIMAKGATKAFVGSDQEFYSRIGLKPVFRLHVWEKAMQE